MYTYWRWRVSSISGRAGARPGSVRTRHERCRLGDDVVRRVEERDEVERVVDLRVALAADVEHLDDLELAGGERVLLDEQFRRRRLRLAERG